MGEKRKMTEEEKMEKMKAYQRKRSLARKQERIASGVCVKCGKTNDRNLCYCSLCSKREGNRSKATKKKKKLLLLKNMVECANAAENLTISFLQLTTSTMMEEKRVKEKIFIAIL